MCVCVCVCMPGGAHVSLARVHEGVAGTDVDLQLLDQLGLVLNDVGGGEGSVQRPTGWIIWRMNHSHVCIIIIIEPHT